MPSPQVSFAHRKSNGGFTPKRKHEGGATAGKRSKRTFRRATFRSRLDALEPQTTARVAAFLASPDAAFVKQCGRTGGRVEVTPGRAEAHNLKVPATCPNGRRRRRHEALRSPNGRFHDC